MKHALRLLLAPFLLCAACVQDIELPGTGWLIVQPPQCQVQPQTRAAESGDYLVSVSLNNADVLPPTPFAQLGGEPVALSEARGYLLRAESCTPAQAQAEPTPYGQPRYEGVKTFDIQAGASTRVEVTCTMANAAFQVVPDESFPYTHYEVRATLGARTLSFTSSSQTGYFNVSPSAPTMLQYEIEATSPGGHTLRTSGELSLKPRTLSVLRLHSRTGQLHLQITYDDHFTPVTVPLLVEP